MPFRHVFAVYLNKFPRYSFVCNLMGNMQQFPRYSFVCNLKGNMQKSWIIKKVQTKKFLNFPKCNCGFQFIQ